MKTLDDIRGGLPEHPPAAIFAVVSHTHWDREWYMPLESMRLRLCELLDHCLEIMEREPSYIFHLDAQTVVLEDYLTIHTDKRDQLERRIAEGRLVVGPWYLQNDFYLTSGEATVRNLLEGRRLAAEFGGCAEVGYAPDQFGNITQLPQILRGFGIDNVVFGRGFIRQLPDGTATPSEFIWEGPDGTRALAIHLRCWYNNAQHFSPDPEKAKRLAEINEANFKNVAATPYLLLMNGVDHLEPQGDLLPILEEINRAWAGEKTIRQVRLQDYVDDVRAYVTEKQPAMYIHKGELRTGFDIEILKGTLSSRAYLKIANVKAQTMLENRLEPLYAMLELAGAKGAYSLNHFRYMWKELMKNHPHDSICGCSRDEVHDHMEDNYARLETTMTDMLARGMRCAAAHLDTAGKRPDNYLLAVANTTQTVMDGVVEATVDIPQSDGARGIRIVDGEGRPADYLVISKTDAVRDGVSALNLPGNFPVDRYRIYLRAEGVQPFAVKGYVVTGTAEESAPEALGAGAPAVMENDAARVTVDPSGRVELLDKRGGRRIADVLDIEETADRGDSYRYHGDGGEPIYGSAFPAVVETVQHNRMVQEIRITRDMELPAYFDYTQRRRATETVVNRATLTLRLTAGESPLEVTFTVDNRSRDHRFRLVARTDVRSDRTTADSPFDLVTRLDSDHAEDLQGKTLPCSTFAALQAEGRGFAVLTEGAHEFEHLEDGGSLAFTLVRGNGVINRDAETLIPSGGDMWVVPGNQCLRVMTGRFALVPYEGDLLEAAVPVRSAQFRAGLSVEYTSCDETRFMCGRPAVQDSQLAEYFFLPDPYAGARVPDNRPLITVEGRGLLVTALKKAQDGEGLVVRAVNLAEEPREVAVQAGSGLTLTDLREEAAEPVHGPVTLGGKAIATWRIATN